MMDFSSLIAKEIVITALVMIVAFCVAAAGGFVLFHFVIKYW